MLQELLFVFFILLKKTNILSYYYNKFITWCYSYLKWCVVWWMYAEKKLLLFFISKLTEFSSKNRKFSSGLEWWYRSDEVGHYSAYVWEWVVVSFDREGGKWSVEMVSVLWLGEGGASMIIHVCVDSMQWWLKSGLHCVINLHSVTLHYENKFLPPKTFLC